MMKSLSHSQEAWGLNEEVCVFVNWPSEESNLCQLLNAGIFRCSPPQYFHLAIGTNRRNCNMVIL